MSSNPLPVPSGHQPDTTGVTMLSNAVLTAIANPGVPLNLVRRLTAPAVVCLRHEFGERYYRLGGFVRVFTYLVLLTPSVLPLMYGDVMGPICFLAGWALDWTVLWWLWRCDRECRREIAARRRSGVIVHSWSAGVPRFGLPNNETTNLVIIPLGLFVVGLIVAPLTFGIGCYLCFSAIGIYAEGAYRRRLAREAELDARDRLEAAGTQSVRREATLPAQTSQTAPSSAADPLAGFGSVLSDP